MAKLLHSRFQVASGGLAGIAADLLQKLGTKRRVLTPTAVEWGLPRTEVRGARNLCGWALLPMHHVADLSRWETVNIDVGWGVFFFFFPTLEKWRLLENHKNMPCDRFGTWL